MTTSENEAQPVVREMRGSLVHFEAGRQRESGCFVTKRILFFQLGSLPPGMVDQFSMRGCRDPGRWILRNSFFRPGGERGSKSLLHGFFGAIERSGDANQRRDDPSGFQ